MSIPLITGPVKGDDLNKVIVEVNEALSVVESGGSVSAIDVTFNPSGLSHVTSIEVQNAIAELDAAISAGGATNIGQLTDAKTDYPHGNMFLGNQSGAAIDDGTNNTCLGNQAGKALDSATTCTALGDQALKVATTSSNSTAIGASALIAQTTGDGCNTAIGVNAMLALTTGSFNTAVGIAAGESVIDALESIFIGENSGLNLESGTNNIYIGTNGCNASGATVNNEVVLGSGAVGRGDNTMQIGNFSTTDVYVGNPANIVIHGSIKTANTDDTTAPVWQLGGVVVDTSTPDSTQYIQVMLNGVPYKLVIAT